MEIEEILKKDYKQDMSLMDGLALSVKAMKKVLGENFNVDRLDAAYISAKDKEFKKFKKEEINSVLNGKKRKK